VKALELQLASAKDSLRRTDVEVKGNGGKREEE
jgi:hypothetical protein